MSIISFISEEVKMAYDDATSNKEIGVIIRRLANGWYDDVYKGEQRKKQAVAILKQEGIWELLNFKDKIEKKDSFEEPIVLYKNRRRKM